MANSGGIISAPVGINDLQSVLGTNYNDLGDIIVQEWSKINKWSKYKPVKYSYLFTEGRPNWWKDDWGQCGILIPASHNDAKSAGEADWGYNYPTGGQNEPFRLSDFIGYNHNAVPFLALYAEEQAAYDISYNMIATYMMYVNEHTGMIQTSDFPSSFGQMYFAVYIENASYPEVSYMQTSEHTLSWAVSNGLLQIEVDWSQVTTSPSNWKVYYMLSDVQYLTLTSQIAGGEYFPIPKAPGYPIYTSVQITNEVVMDYSITVSQIAKGRFPSSATYADWTSYYYLPSRFSMAQSMILKCTLTAGSTAFTWYNSRLRFTIGQPDREVLRTWDDADGFEVYDDTFTQITSKSVAAYQTVTLYIVFQHLNYDENANLPTDGTTYTMRVKIEELSVNVNQQWITEFDDWIYAIYEESN
jgi:hypothetical protein